MPVIEFCDECHAKAGTCNCYDWETDKQTCIDWLFKAEGDYTANLVELEGYFQSVPDEVCDAFERLNSRGRIEVIYESSKKVLNEN